jgi:transcriptional regulator with XRE-family HTH domain
MSFGRHLRALRDEAALSREELARLASLPADTLRHWEHDRGFPSLAAGLRMAGALGVAIERLAEGVEDPVEEETGPLVSEPKGRRGGNKGGAR